MFELYAGELDRQLDGTKLARPCGSLWAGPDGDSGRDPAGEWDWWYALSVPERRWIHREHMSERGSHPADLADWNGCSSVDDWADGWLRVVRAQRRDAARAVADRIRDPLSRAYADDWEQWESDQAAANDLFGPQELAKALGISVGAIYQRRRRGQLPGADLIISGVPIWSAETLRDILK